MLEPWHDAWLVTVITFAHRGARLEEPENTLPAFRRALDLGASGLETDVWLSSDREVVCVHDPVIGRARRRRKVAATSAAELAEIGVPRMADVYAALGTAFACSVDVKTPEAADGLIEVGREFDALERLWVCSDDVELLRGLRTERRVKLVHSQPRRGIGVPMERHAHELAAIGVDAMNLHHSEWSAGLVSLFHRYDIKAFAWDTQEVRHIRAALRMGVDAIYCDRPDRMVATVSEWTVEDA
jgi:glycerophosphoryl diester phosphodiesterase